MIAISHAVKLLKYAADAPSFENLCVRHCFTTNVEDVFLNIAIKCLPRRAMGVRKKVENLPECTICCAAYVRCDFSSFLMTVQFSCDNGTGLFYAGLKLTTQCQLRLQASVCHLSAHDDVSIVSAILLTRGVLLFVIYLSFIF
jgi:hypothetical protein